MRRPAVLILIPVIVLTAACATIRLVSDYDEVIDAGATEFAERFNAHIKNMSDLGGTREGTYEANITTYNELDAKISVLIDRATVDSEEKACSLESRLYDRIEVLFKDIPPGLLTQDAASDASTSSACNARLLVLVKRQLQTVREIHMLTDKCPDRTDQAKQLSCLRPATATDIVDIANQSIRAVTVVEAAKKKL